MTPLLGEARDASPGETRNPALRGGSGPLGERRAELHENGVSISQRIREDHG